MVPIACPLLALLDILGDDAPHVPVEPDERQLAVETTCWRDASMSDWISGSTRASPGKPGVAAQQLTWLVLYLIALVVAVAIVRWLRAALCWPQGGRRHDECRVAESARATAARRRPSGGLHRRRRAHRYQTLVVREFSCREVPPAGRRTSASWPRTCMPVRLMPMPGNRLSNAERLAFFDDWMANDGEAWPQMPPALAALAGDLYAARAERTLVAAATRSAPVRLSSCVWPTVRRHCRAWIAPVVGRSGAALARWPTILRRQWQRSAWQAKRATSDPQSAISALRFVLNLKAEIRNSPIPNNEVFYG